MASPGKTELVCIACPIGCRLEAAVQEDGALIVTGNQCPRGAQYAQDEIFDPRRTVTATCRVRSARFHRLPVKTEQPCPKDKIDRVLAAIYAAEAVAPVASGDTIVEIDEIRVVATRSIPE